MPHHLAAPGARRQQAAAAGRCSTSRRGPRPWSGSRPSAEHGSGGGALHGDKPDADASSSSPGAARTVALSWSGHVPDEAELMQHLQLQLELVDAQCQNLYQQLDTVKQQQRAERHAAAIKLAAEQAHHAETMTELVAVSAELHALQSELEAAQQALALSRPVTVTFVIGGDSNSSSSGSSNNSNSVAAPGGKQPTADTEASAMQQKPQSEPASTRTAGAAVVVGELEAQHVTPAPVQPKQQQLLLLQQQDGQARASEGGSIACGGTDATAAASIKRSASEPSGTCLFVPAPPSTTWLTGGSAQAKAAAGTAEACPAGNKGSGSISSGGGFGPRVPSCDNSSMRATDDSKCSAGGVSEASAASEQPHMLAAALALADKPGKQPTEQPAPQQQQVADRLEAESAAAAAAMLRAPFNFCSSRVVPVPELVAEQPVITKPSVTFSFTAAPGPAAKSKKKSSFSFRGALRQLKKPDTTPPAAAASATRHSGSGGSRVSEGGGGARSSNSGGRSSNSGGCSVIPIGRFVADSRGSNTNKISLLSSTRAFFSRSESCSAEVRSSRAPVGPQPGKRVAGSNLSTMLGRFGAKKVKN